MIIRAYRHQYSEYSSLFEQMYRLRAQQFKERRGWEVRVQDGQEIDFFDQQDPLYIMVVSETGQLVASLRLLPTTGPHMLSDVFPEVMGESDIIRHPLIWESSRFCVDTKAAATFGPEGINLATKELLVGLFSTAKLAGMENIISVYDLFLERILRRAGCDFDRIGTVHKFGGLKTTAGLFDTTRQTFINDHDFKTQENQEIALV